MSTRFEPESISPLSVFFEEAEQEGETRGRRKFRDMRAPTGRGGNRFDSFSRRQSCHCHQNRSDSRRSKFGTYNLIPEVFEQSEGEAFEYEFNPSDFPSSILALMRMGFERSGLRVAIAFGFRNENQLTDLVFHARHQERLGRGINAREANHSILVNEWVSIRDTVVRPVLRDSATPAATGHQPSPPTSVSQPAVGNTTRKGCKQDLCDPAYVRWVQQSLNQILGLRLTENGHTDGNTWSAIGRFQKKSGLKVDFTVGPNTRQALLAAGASQPPPLKDLPCGPTSGPDLARLLNKYRLDIPLHFLLGWIEVESGRRIDSSTYLCERGYFQIHPDQSKDLGWNHEPLSYDPDYSIKRGVELVRAMVRATEKLATKYGVSKASDAFWGLVKMYHWIPSSPEKILAHMSSRGRRPTSWTAIMQYIVGEKTPIPALGTWDPIEGATNADKTLEKAKMWKTALPTNGSN